MNLPRFACVIAAAAAVLVATQPARAQTAETLAIGVFPKQYIVAGRSVDDLDALERLVRRSGARRVTLDACGMADSLAQRAAAHRLRHLYVELRVFDDTDAACAAHASFYVMTAGAPSAGAPRGIDRAAVDAWWHSLMP